MEVSYHWLQEYLQLDVDPQQLADKISRTGIEVDSTHVADAGLKKLVVGHILDVKQHPNADHLHICQVDVGNGEVTQIICGAPNVAKDQYVIVALPGARIANNIKIKKGKMRGEASNGMICGLQEIGFSDAVVPKEFSDGIYVFKEPVQVGSSVFPYLGMDDPILSLEITPNRADALGMHGVAWEVGAIYDQKPHFETVKVNEDADLKVTDLLTAHVADDKLAPSYQLRVIKNVKIQASPMWLQIRLWNAGIRPINNIVDATNYMMLTYGQPLHAYDYDKIAGHELNVRYAHKGEKLVTLDEKEHELYSDDIVIADGEKPVALAGVMGGLNSEVSDQTTNIILESASFDATSVRKTAQRHNCRTAASSRFEKGTNLADINTALDATAELITQLSNGSDVATGTLSASSVTPLPVVIDISLDRINHVLGTHLSGDEVQSIFKRLGFEVTNSDDLFSVSVPPRRWDITIEADLIEEVVRLYGYDKLPATLPTMAMTTGALDEQQQLLRDTRHYLESAGLDQAISYALTTEEKATQFMQATSYPTKVAWPMTNEHVYLRENLVSGLLNDIAYNVARKQTDVALYEQGKVFLKDDENEKRPTEVAYVAGAMTGLAVDNGWNTTKRAVDFYDIKGVVDFLLSNYHLQGAITYRATKDRLQMHPGRTADIYVGDTLVGFVGQVHPTIAKAYAIPATYVFQINMDQILALPKQSIKSQPTPKFPTVDRDIALLVDADLTNEQVKDVIIKNGDAYLQAVTLFDVYTGENIAQGKKSLAYTLVFLNREQTLTEDQVNSAMNKIIKHLETDLDAQVR